MKVLCLPQVSHLEASNSQDWVERDQSMVSMNMLTLNTCALEDCDTAITITIT